MELGGAGAGAPLDAVVADHVELDEGGAGGGEDFLDVEAVGGHQAVDNDDFFAGCGFVGAKRGDFVVGGKGVDGFLKGVE